MTCKNITNQAYKDFEWIVIDGGSTDGTINVLNKYKKYMTKFTSEKDGGVYDAMNKGIKLAKGDYILFLNGGDSFYSSHTLEQIVQSKLTGDVIYGNCVVRGVDGSQHIIDFPNILDKNYFLEHCINHQSTLIKRSLFERWGLYDATYKINGDWEKWLCFLSKKVVFKKLPFVVACYKGYDGLSSSNKNKSIFDKEKWLIFNKYYSTSEIMNFYKEKIISLEQELLDIKSTKFFKVWRKYCAIKESIIGPPKKIV